MTRNNKCKKSSSAVLAGLATSVLLFGGCGTASGPAAAEDPAASTASSASSTGTPAAPSSSAPTFDPEVAAANLIGQLKDWGDSYQFTYQTSDAPVLREGSTIDGVSLLDAMSKAKELPLTEADQVIEGNLFAPNFGKTISRDPLVVDPYFNHAPVWVIRRFHVETASHQKIGAKPNNSTYFVDLVEFLKPDGTFVALQVPELN